MGNRLKIIDRREFENCSMFMIHIGIKRCKDELKDTGEKKQTLLKVLLYKTFLSLHD